MKKIDQKSRIIFFSWQVLEGVVLQMDPSLRPDQAETFTEVLKAMGDAAKSPEVVQEISVAVKKIEEGISAATFSIRLHCWSIGQPFRSTFKRSTVLWPSVVWPSVFRSVIAGLKCPPGFPFLLGSQLFSVPFIKSLSETDSHCQTSKNELLLLEFKFF